MCVICEQTHAMAHSIDEAMDSPCWPVGWMRNSADMSLNSGPPLRGRILLLLCDVVQ